MRAFYFFVAAVKDTLVIGFPSAEQIVNNPSELVSCGGDGLGFAEFPSDAPKTPDVSEMEFVARDRQVHVGLDDAFVAMHSPVATRLLTQQEEVPGHWDMTTMSLEMTGKALLFKSIGVQKIEKRRGFQVSDDLTLTQAADILNRHIVVADNR